MKQYAERDIMALDEEGGYYCKHVGAMTSEGLHDKGDIAAELAYRDAQIDRLRLELAAEKQRRKELELFRKEHGVVNAGLIFYVWVKPLGRSLNE